jgi:hypothetical protein
MSNLELWEKVERTNPVHTKAITGKSYQGTSPKPHYLVHKATEAFGPCGIGWGFTIVSERIEEGAGGERMHIAHVRVWYEWQGKRGEVEHIGGTQFSGIRSSGKPFTDEDAPKKSVTDALVKALSMIGFAGDIFMGRYDDSKYVNELRNETPERSSEPRVAPTSSPLLQDRVEKGQPTSSGTGVPPGQKATAQRGLYDRLSKANRDLKTIAEFNDFWDHKATQAAYWGFPDDWKSSLDAEKRDKEAELSERAKAVVSPEATLDKIAAGQDGYGK